MGDLLGKKLKITSDISQISTQFIFLHKSVIYLPTYLKPVVSEYTSVPKIKLRFYRITSGALKFSVKGEKQYRGYYNNERPAAVGLARRPGDKCDYWVT